jgi:Holliday junction resolvase RusA-like endonuclease
VTHANPKTKDWMNSVKWFAMKAANRMLLLDEAVRLELVFLYERPKSHYGTGRNAGCLKSSAPMFYEKTTNPDLTKIVRAVEDALTGIIWKDDSIVVQQLPIKLYCCGDEKPGVMIKITTMSEVADELHVQADRQLTHPQKQQAEEFAFSESL